VVFPRAPVEIRPESEAPVIAQPNHVMLYNGGDAYTRRAIDARGDASDYFWIREDALIEMVASVRPEVVDAPARPFGFRFRPVSARLYLHQRALFDAAVSGAIDGLAIEEGVLCVIERLVREAFDTRAAGHRVRLETRKAHREAAHAAAERLASASQDRWTIAALSEEVCASPHHLCRVFRREHGVSIHAYLTSLRLRDALERVLETAEGLTQIGLACGFSSHAHFTSAFAKAFGLPPSRIRAEARRGSLTAVAALY
jgi:AraC-like DNA-binding protein